MNHRLFLHTLEKVLEMIDLNAYYMVSGHYGPTVRAVQDTIDAVPARTVKDFEDQIARMEASPVMAERLWRVI